MHEQAIQHYFADKEPMLVEAVSRLVRIDSTLGPALPGKPFGEGPAAALEELHCQYLENRSTMQRDVQYILQATSLLMAGCCPGAAA